MRDQHDSLLARRERIRARYGLAEEIRPLRLTMRLRPRSTKPTIMPASGG